MLLTKKQAISIYCVGSKFFVGVFFLHYVSEIDKMFGPVSLEISTYKFHFTHEKRGRCKSNNYRQIFCLLYFAPIVLATLLLILIRESG